MCVGDCRLTGTAVYGRLEKHTAEWSWHESQKDCCHHRSSFGTPCLLSSSYSSVNGGVIPCQRSGKGRTKERCDSLMQAPCGLAGVHEATSPRSKLIKTRYRLCHAPRPCSIAASPVPHLAKPDDVASGATQVVGHLCRSEFECARQANCREEAVGLVPLLEARSVGRRQE